MRGTGDRARPESALPPVLPGGRAGRRERARPAASKVTGAVVRSGGCRWPDRFPRAGLVLVAVAVVVGCRRSDRPSGEDWPAGLVPPISPAARPIELRPPGTPSPLRVAVTREAVFCGGRRVARIHDAGRLPMVDEGDKSGGRQGLLIDDLLGCLTASLPAAARPSSTGPPHVDPEAVLLAVDARLPVRVVKEVLFTIREAGVRHVQLVVRNAGSGSVTSQALRTGAAGLAVLDVQNCPPGAFCRERRWARDPECRVLGLVVVVTNVGLQVAVSDDVKDVVFSDERLADGVVVLPNRSLSSSDGVETSFGCSDPGGRDDGAGSACVNHMRAFGDLCGEPPRTSIADLVGLHAVLGRIKDRAVRAFGEEGVVDADAIVLRVDDEVSWCAVAGIISIATFRSFAFDWRAHEPFNHQVEALVESGISAPFIDPDVWNEPMRAEMLFPIWRL